ncbi:DMT family transporter [Gracilimonas sp.]|uniref:DMT family transporter n=1 Tax=Gracilimonas sp. TaxID=1974203 RepID=UPI0028723F36|nr:DMT family transporter [Gracilimonas sp.]
MSNKYTLALAVGFVLLWNSGFIGAEYGLPFTGPFTLVFWRYLALTLLLAGYLLLRKRFLWVGWKTAVSNMIIGVLAHGVWLTCVLFALDNKVPAGIVALIVALQPLATGALSGLITGEQTNTYQWMGLLLGFLGVLVTVIFRIDFTSYQSIFGYLIPLLSVVAITIASLIQRRMELKSETKKLPIDLTLFYQSLATTAVLALPAIYAEQLYTEWTPVFIYTMIWLILAVSLGAYALMWLLIERILATRVASLFYFGPPVTMLMAWMAFGDTLLLMDIVGLAIVFLGVLLTQFGNQRKRG